MKKTILTVFLVLAVLVMIFLIWELFFDDKGILHSIYNTIAKGVNSQWNKVTGDTTTADGILPLWDGGSQGGEQTNDTDDSEGGWGIDLDE